MTLTVPPLTDALSAVTRSLTRCGVTPVRFSPAAALHRLEYDLDGDVIGAVGWTDGLWLDDELSAEVRALIVAHAQLSCASPTADRLDYPQPSDEGGVPHESV